ncbi:MAG: ATP-grasp domain-containing protein [Candidatus Omnitrophica bacterium]|nr:ATP-grasp domain-containing protein [Candidatus Omnitrophota bacterium]
MKRALLLFDTPVFHPRGYEYKQEFREDDWMTEDEVYRALKQCGYEVRLLGLHDDLSVLFEEIDHTSPDFIFNLTEVFRQKTHYDKHVAALLEMLEIPYTGASAECLFLCGDKGLTKKILRFHRIQVPRFYVFYRNQRVWLPKRLRMPLIVKPLQEEASRGISQASLVEDEQALIERVRFLHDHYHADAIAEEYIDGREFYVSILGNRRLQVLPVREMKFGQIHDDEPRIATYKAKWDYEYRERKGIKNVFPGKLPNGLQERIEETCKRAYRALNMQCYARFDVRVNAQGRIYVLEANANPCLSRYDELAESAVKADIPYVKLIQRIVRMALKRT